MASPTAQQSSQQSRGPGMYSRLLTSGPGYFHPDSKGMDVELDADTYTSLIAADHFERFRTKDKEQESGFCNKYGHRFAVYSAFLAVILTIFLQMVCLVCLDPELFALNPETFRFSGQWTGYRRWNDLASNLNTSDYAGVVLTACRFCASYVVVFGILEEVEGRISGLQVAMGRTSLALAEDKETTIELYKKFPRGSLVTLAQLFGLGVSVILATVGVSLVYKAKEPIEMLLKSVETLFINEIDNCVCVYYLPGEIRRFHFWKKHSRSTVATGVLMIAYGLKVFVKFTPFLPLVIGLTPNVWTGWALGLVLLVTIQSADHFLVFEPLNFVFTDYRDLMEQKGSQEGPKDRNFGEFVHENLKDMVGAGMYSSESGGDSDGSVPTNGHAGGGKRAGMPTIEEGNEDGEHS